MIAKSLSHNGLMVVGRIGYVHQRLLMHYKALEYTRQYTNLRSNRRFSMMVRMKETSQIGLLNLSRNVASLDHYHGTVVDDVPHSANAAVVIGDNISDERELASSVGHICLSSPR